MRYAIPDFKIDDLMTALYGSKFVSSGGGLYTFCPFNNHSTPGRYGTFRVYRENGRHGTAVCPCGVKGTVWDILAEHEGLPAWGSLDFDETILFVCETLNIPPVLLADAPAYDAGERTKLLYREILLKLQPLRFEQPNEHFSHGQYRGFDPLQWLGQGVGRLHPEALAELQKVFMPEDFETAGMRAWSDSGHQWLTHGALMIRRNENNIPVGVAVRRYDEFSGGPIGKTKYAKNSNNPVMVASEYIFGIRHALKHQSPVLYVTEGEFDALMLQLYGIRNAVGLGMGLPSNAHMDRLEQSGREIRFLMDSDPNNAGLKHATEIAKRAPHKTSFVFLPPGENGTKSDPDTFVRTHGRKALLALDVYTGLQVLMLQHPRDEKTGRWAAEPTALAEQFMQDIVAHPSARDLQNVYMVSLLSGIDETALRSWLFRERNRESLAALLQSDRPLQITAGQ